VKLATGAFSIPPVPVTVLVALPPLSVAKTTVLVNPLTLDGANCTNTLVELNPGTLKVAPDTIVNGPPVTVAVPLLTVVPTELVTVKLARAVVPVVTVPKSSVPGETMMLPGAVVNALMQTLQVGSNAVVASPQDVPSRLR
jgi:hypothetical protein